MRSLLLALALLATLAGAAGAQEPGTLNVFDVARPKDGVEPVGAIAHLHEDQWLSMRWKASQRLDDVTIFRCTAGCGRAAYRVAVKDLDYRKGEILRPGRYHVVEYRTLNKLDGWTVRVPILEKLD